MAKESRGYHTVLLLHAFPLSAAMWQAQIHALGDASYTVIAPNSYGVEGSEKKENWTFTDYAHELAALLELLDIKQVTVVGLSMGGYQAFELYRLYPEKISSLVLCDTRANKDTPEALAIREKFILAVEKRGVQEAVERMIPNYFSDRLYTLREKVVEQAEAMIRNQTTQAINAAMRAIMLRNDATSLLKGIHCPVLVMNGADDKLTTWKTAADISDHIAGAKLLVLAAAGHIANLEQPDAFNQALLNHIANLK